MIQINPGQTLIFTTAFFADAEGRVPLNFTQGQVQIISSTLTAIDAQTLPTFEWFDQTRGMGALMISLPLHFAAPARHSVRIQINRPDGLWAWQDVPILVGWELQA